MIRNFEDLNLEDIDEAFLFEQAEQMGEKLGVDTREGSIYMDASSGHIIRTAKFFDDMRQIKTIISLSSCTGDVLTEKMAEQGLQRNPPVPTPATYDVEFVGTQPEVGDRMTVGEYYFEVQTSDEGKLILVSEETGTDLNTLAPGTVVIPEWDVDGLESATLGAILVPAQNEESDDDARQRLIEKIAGPAENGNIHQYKSWCEEVDGVGSARIIPLWNGPNTVKAILIGVNGKPAAESVVKAVQDYIDPGGNGMGQGVASIGACFVAVPAIAVIINISVSIQKASSATIEEIKEQIVKLITEYFRKNALDSSDFVVRYNWIGSQLVGIDGIVDYDRLLINESNSNVEIGRDSVAVLGEVTVNEYIL
ncbi:baseplate J/gp47 family protein [Parablautia sp. Marseille-Q6255]|uniref:baseplate J/gp47 family protein n=1 Tax=Parablautia sp. Marseille-Q6255 TaxID=3039593 RepID=UPI0024BC5404|nr:baseplate J/gp47 family protein [Parablautia sp. Marseille-Q6255]